MKIDTNTSIEDLRPGDIMVKDGHVEIFGGLQGDKVLQYSWGNAYEREPNNTMNSNSYFSYYGYEGYWRDIR